MRISAWIVMGLTAAGVAQAGAQGAVGTSMLPMLDFDRIHTVLMERCTAASPETLPALTDAVKGWRNQNYVPQQLLQAYAMGGIAGAAQAQGAPNTPALNPAQFKEALKMIQDASVAKFMRESAAWDQEKMRKYCMDYPKQLQSPEMNFAARYQQEKAKIDAAIARDKEKNAESPVEGKAP